jgi:hypothetical protein
VWRIFGGRSVNNQSGDIKALVVIRLIFWSPSNGNRAAMSQNIVSWRNLALSIYVYPMQQDNSFKEIMIASTMLLSKMHQPFEKREKKVILKHTAQNRSTNVFKLKLLRLHV